MQRARLFLLPAWGALLASALLAVAVEAAEPPPQPNIVVILADDLGWSDLGCYGNRFHETPHLDRLAAEGTKFTNAYAAAAVCSPTRASLLTGKYPARLRLTHIIQAAPANRNGFHDPEWTPYLPLAERTLAEALHGAGYVAALIGKWHLGGHPGRSAEGDGAERNPLRQGFDVNIAGSDLGQPPDYFFPYSRQLSSDETVRLSHLEGGQEAEFLTDRLTDEAEKFIEQNRARPFFLFLSHFAPHTAMGDRIQAPADLIEKFRQKAEATQSKSDPVYAALVANLDQNVGRVLKKLDDLALAENTLVIFTSDNGGYGAKTSNLPLRGAKHSPYEGGLRVPLIIRWKGKTQAKSSSIPVVTPDLYPTILNAADIPRDLDPAIDGQNLLPVATTGVELRERNLYWHSPHCDAEPYSVVRRGKFKLIEFLLDRRIELFDLEEDLGETRNLANSEAEVALTLRQDLDRWRKSVGAQLPIRVRE